MPDRPAPLVFLAGPESDEQPFGSYRAALAGGRHLLAAEMSQRLGAEGAAVAILPRAPAGTDFHWGAWFAASVQATLTSATGRVEAIGWVGAGSLGLLGDADLSSLLAARPGEVVANNRYSADAFVVAGDLDAALAVIEHLAADNAAPRALESAGFTVRDMADAPFSRFDVDTPQDLALLRLAGHLPGHRSPTDAVRAFLDGVRLPGGRPLELPRLPAILAVLRDRAAELVVAGRVPSATFGYLEREAACRVRLFVEERGMRAVAGHRPQSLLALIAQREGPAALVEHLGQLGNAVILDSRVLLAALSGSTRPDDWAPPEERFASDFGDAAAIGPGLLHDLTAAARTSATPFLLGGHALVSDGLRLLTEAAWHGR